MAAMRAMRSSLILCLTMMAAISLSASAAETVAPATLTVAVPPGTPGADEPAPDCYSVGQDAVIATLSGRDVTWSDFARYLIEAWGTQAAAGHFDQLTYSQILRSDLEQAGLVVTRGDLYAELERAFSNSRAGDPSLRNVEALEEFLRRICIQTGKTPDAYTMFNWGYAAQSKLVDHRWSEAERRKRYEEGGFASYKPSVMVAHILAQTLAGKRTREEARARIEQAAALIADEAPESTDAWNQACWELTDDFAAVPVNMGNPDTVFAASERRPVLGFLNEFNADTCPFGAPMWEAASELEPGEVSEIFETEWGFHIVKLLTRKDLSSYEKAAPRIHGLLSGEYLREARARGSVEPRIFAPGEWVVEPFAGEDMVIAVVEGTPLYLSDFGRLLWVNIGPRDGARYRSRMLERLAIWMAADDLGVTVTDAEVEAALRSDMADRTGDALGDLDAWLTETSTRARGCAAHTRAMRREKLRRERTIDLLTRDEDRIRAFWRDSPQLYNDLWQTRSIKILVQPLGQHSVEEAREIAERIHQDRLLPARELLEPERRGHPDEDYFPFLVDAFCEWEITRRRGGEDNPWRVGRDGGVGNSGLGLEFERAVVAAGPGGAGIARTHNGFTVFEVIDHQPGQSADEAREDILARLRAHAPELELRKRPHTIAPDLLGFPDNQRCQ
jgi:hypothetical protein